MTRGSQIRSLFVAATFVFALAGTATIFYANRGDASLTQTPPLYNRMEASDPGVPRIVYNTSRTIVVYGYNVLLNGFRFGGHYTKARGRVEPLVRPNGVYDYDTYKVGIGPPALSAAAAGTTCLNGPTSEMWVAVFAVSGPSDTTATIRFVPFLLVVSYQNGVVQFLSNVGTLTPNFFAGGEALVIKESGVFSNKVVIITANTENSITLGAPLQLAPGDYVLPSPGPNVDYKYLRSLKLDYSPTVAGGSEWRNFVFSQGRTYSRTGNPFGTITNSNLGDSVLDFSHCVSPLATGVLGSANAYYNHNITSGSVGPSAYIYLSHDSSPHVIVQVGIDRTFTGADGVTGNFLAGFGRKQSLWPYVNTVGVVGTVTILGWVED